MSLKGLTFEVIKVLKLNIANTLFFFVYNHYYYATQK